MIKVDSTIPVLLFLCGFGISESARAQNEDLRQDISEEEYLQTLEFHESRLQDSDDAVTEARTTLYETLALLEQAEAAFKEATALFAQVETNPVQPDGPSPPDTPNALNDAWTAVASAWARLQELTKARDSQQMELVEAEEEQDKRRIWVEKHKNDYEAQSEPFAVRDAIARCATETCLASDFLDDERVSVFQPNVLEMIGAHHAYAKGLTGEGIRIGIEDDIVSYRLPEFEGRISFDGANLLYPLFESDERYADAQTCDAATASERGELKCAVIFYESDDETNLFDNLVARWTVARNGWPGEGETWYIRNDAYEDGEWGRWAILPHGGRGEDAQGRYSTHGTAVASVAAGRDFGVAPGAMIVPIAKDFSSEGQSAQRTAERSLLRQIRDMSAQDRRTLDAEVANQITDDYQHYDIINRSFGIGVFDPASISAILDDETQWWGERFREILPQTWRAFMQTGVHPDDRTVVVYATGNQTEEFGGLGADIPRYETHVRGSQLAVMAVDHHGYHADYTNFCGALPSDWDANRWGRHFCLAAPGTANAASSWGWDWLQFDVSGTSFAAPVVSGALALLMEHFRGQLGNVEIVKRLVDTANNTGHYAQLEIYGAGLLDLEAALQPVGDISTGTPSGHTNTALTLLSLPPAIGGLGQRFADQGVEVASLDSLGAPFWSSPARFMQVATWMSPGLIPIVSRMSDEGDDPHLGFTPRTVAIPIGVDERKPFGALGAWDRSNQSGASALRLLKGADRIGVERTPVMGYRWGVLEDGSSWLGGFPSGAFGNRVGSTTVWFGRSARFTLGSLWTMNVSGTLALTHAKLPPGSMLEVDSHVMSTWHISAERGMRGHGEWFRFALSQPVRAETGTGTLTYLAGLNDGAPVYEQARTSLVPEGRELELSFTHETPIARGRVVVKFAHSFNFLHEADRADSRIGLAYRFNWQ